MLVDKGGDGYQMFDRFEKTALSRGIVKIIQQTKGRVLRRTDSGNGWVKVSDVVAREKVSHSLRMRTRQQKQSQISPSSFFVPVSHEDVDDDTGSQKHNGRLKKGLNLIVLAILYVINSAASICVFHHLEHEFLGAIVAVYDAHSTGDYPKLDSELSFSGRRISECLPHRSVGVHFCYDDSRLHPVMTMVQMLIGRRGRPHFGEYL